MKYSLLPLLGAFALLTGCAVEPAYVEGGPARVYGPGPGYYAPGPVYGGTTVIAVEHDRYVDHDHYYHDGRDHYQTSRYSRPNDRAPRYQNKGGSNRGGNSHNQPVRPVTRKKDDKKKHDQH